MEMRGMTDPRVSTCLQNSTNGRECSQQLLHFYQPLLPASRLHKVGADACGYSRAQAQHAAGWAWPARRPCTHRTSLSPPLLISCYRDDALTHKRTNPPSPGGQAAKLGRSSRGIAAGRTAAPRRVHRSCVMAPAPPDLPSPRPAAARARGFPRLKAIQHQGCRNSRACVVPVTHVRPGRRGSRGLNSCCARNSQI